MSDEQVEVQGPSDLDAAPATIAPAVIRTMVPMLVSIIVGWAARKGFEIDDATRQMVVGVVSMLVGTGYYTMVRELERINPKLGWLLGSPHAPVYPTKIKTPAVVVEPDAEGDTNG